MGGKPSSTTFEAILDLLDVPVSLHDDSRVIVYQNASHRALFGDAVGCRCHSCLWGETSPCPRCPPPGSPDAMFRTEVCGFGEAEVLVKRLPGEDSVLLEVIRHPVSEACLPGALRSVLDGIDAAVFVEDMTGRILEANRGAARMFGHPRAELLGRSVRDILPEEALEQLPNVLQELNEQGRFQLESWQRRADGTKFLADVQGTRVDGQAGPLVLVVVRDITAERMARADLEQRSREMEGFLHSVAHDLRTPLASIKGYGSLLIRELVEGPDQARDFAERVVKQTQRLEALLEDLLEVARAEQTEEPVADVKVEAIARRAWVDLGDRVEEADGTLEMPEALPWVRMAPVHLHQVLSNLFTNALKFKQEGVPLVVRVAEVGPEREWAVREDHLCLMVQDNGVGISEEDKDFIFELFRRGRRTGEGQGVGLAIVRRIVESRGGKLWVESSPREGSRFYLTLPRGQPRENP